MAGPGGRSAGRVSVRVVPDSTNFRADLKKALERVERTVQASIPVKLDTDLVRAQLASIARTQVANVNVALDEASYDYALAKLKVLRESLTSNNLKIRVTGQSDIAAAQRQLGALSVPAAPLKALAGIGDALEDMVEGAGKATLGLGAAGAGVSGLVTVAGGAAAALGAAGQSLALLPAFGLAGAAGVGALALAFTGLGEATGAAGDVREVVLGLKDELLGLRSVVQEKVFAGLAEPIADLAQDYLPALTEGLSGIGAAFNSGLGQVIDALRNPISLADTETGLANTTALFNGLADAAPAVVTALRDIAVTGSGFFPAFGEAIATAAQRFAAFTASTAESGAMRDFIAGGLGAVRDLAASVGNLVGVFTGLTTAAGISGTSVTAGLASITGALDAVVNSPAAQAGLSAFFASTNEGISALLASLGETLPGVLGALGPLAGSIVAQLGPLIGALVEALGPAIEALAPSLTNLVNAIGPGLISLVQAVGPLLGAVATALAPVIDAVAAKLGPALESIGPFITNTALPALQNLADLAAAHLGPVLADTFALFKDVGLPALKDLAGFITGTVVPGFIDFAGKAGDTLIPILQDLWGVFRDQILPALQEWGKVFYQDVLPPLVDLGEKLAPVIKFLGELALLIISKVAPVLIDKLGGAVKGTIEKFTEITRKIGEVIQFFADVIGAVTNAGVAFIKFGVTVAAKIAEVVAVVRQLPGQLQAAVGNLAEKFVTVGGDIVRGIVQGIKGGVASVGAAARDMASKALAEARAALGIKSPSTKFREVGEFINAGLAQGITGSVAQVDSAAKKLADAVTAGFLAKAKVDSEAYQAGLDDQIRALRKQAEALDDTAAAKKANATRLAQLDAEITGLQKKRGDADAAFETRALAIADQVMAGLRDQNAALAQIAVARESVADQIEEAQKRLEAAVKLREDFAASITSGALTLGKLTGIKPDMDGEELTADTILSDLGAARNKIQEYSASLLNLKSRGLSDALYRQLAEAGAEGGAALAKALKDASPEQLAEINAYQDDLEGMAKALGDETGGALYNAGVDAAVGLVRGLESQSEALRQAAQKIAATLTSEVKKALGIASPSKVFRALGVNVGEGFTLGIDAQRAAVAASMQAMVALPKVVIPQLPDAGGAGTGATAAGASVTFNHYNQIRSEVDAEVLVRREQNRISALVGLS